MTRPMHKAWRFHAPGDLRYEEVETPPPASTGVVVRIEAAAVLSYHRKVLDGALPFALPPAPFVPGTNAVGRVEAVGSSVVHLRPGQSVFLSPSFTTDERVPDPTRILIGHTAMGGERTLQGVWRDGVFAERAHWPAASVTPIDELAHLPAQQRLVLAKLVVPYGGLLRGRVQPGQVVIVNGATGYYGSAGVLVALAMGASRVVAAGRDAEALSALASRLGPRVVPAVLTGEVEADTATLRERAGGGADAALDLLGRASSTATTLAALRALRREGRLLLMGSASVPLSIGFTEMLANDWEVIGVFMYPKEAPASLARLVASGLLDVSAVHARTHPLADLPQALGTAESMRGLELTALLSSS